MRFLFARRYALHARAFTLIETLVAVSLLSIAIVSPMSLTFRSLAAAYYSRDQITAFHLAQEAIESIRHARDHNILQNAFGTPVDLLAGILSPGETSRTFTVDTRNDATQTCPESGCPPLQTDPNPNNPLFYGYQSGWTDTRFTRTVNAQFVPGTTNEVRISVTVEWTTGAFQRQSVSISENLYRWVRDGSGQ